MSTKLHLAGIVPIANLEADFGNVIPAALTPVASDFTAVQNSVYECAMAGCNTIWIVANDDMAPLIRKVVGEWVYDPVYYRRPSKFSSQERKEIPIYYVPIHPKDRDRRDSYGWSVLYGAYSAWKVSHKISEWVCPDKYYVSFPMGVYDVGILRSHRKLINHRTQNFFLKFQDKTVKDEMLLSFTMFGEDFKRCRQAVNKKTTKTYLSPTEGEKYPSERLPIEERWSARHFTFKDIFGEIDEENSKQLAVDWYCDISDWSGYRSFLGSNNVVEIPEEGLTQPHLHVKLPYTEEQK